MNLRKWTMDHTKGLLLGIITPLILAPLVLWVLAMTQGFYFEQLWHKFSLIKPYQIKIITIAIIANLGWFYLFLNKERYKFAMGVILGTIIFAPYIIYIKFF